MSLSLVQELFLPDSQFLNVKFVSINVYPTQDASFVILSKLHSCCFTFKIFN